MSLKYKMIDGMGLVPFLDKGSILFNIGKQVCHSQKGLTRWVSKAKKNVCLIKKEDNLIEMEVREGKNNGEGLEGLEDLEIRFYDYPFIYYRKIEYSQPGKQDKGLISVVSDLETLKEVIKSDMLNEEQILVNYCVVLHYLQPLNVKVVYQYNNEFIDYYTIAKWLSLDVKVRQQIFPNSFKFDIYEIKREGVKDSYIKSLSSCPLVIDPEIEKIDNIKIFKDGKEVKQGMRYREKDSCIWFIYDGEKSIPIDELFKESE